MHFYFTVPFQNLAPSIIANSAVSPSFYSTFTLTSSSSDTDNDTNQGMNREVLYKKVQINSKIHCKYGGSVQ